MWSPSISILLLLKDHLYFVEKSLPRLRSQEYEGEIEIICVDSGSRDGTIEYLRANSIEAVSIGSRDFHHSKTRNLAASLAQNEILVFLSGDAIPSSGQWLSNLIAPMADKTVQAVFGKQIPPPEVSPVRRRIMARLYHDGREVRRIGPSDPIPLSYVRFSNANAALRASAWRKYRFSGNANVAEDHGMCLNILLDGGAVVYEPGAAVCHAHDWGILGYFRWAAQVGSSLESQGILGHERIESAWGYGLNIVLEDVRHFLSKRDFFSAVRTVAMNGAGFAGALLGRIQSRIADTMRSGVDFPKKYRPVSIEEDNTRSS